MIIQMHSPDAFVIAKDLLTKSVAVQAGANAITKRGALRLVTMVKAHASGRPGPNAPTGDYRRSWSAQFYSVGGATVANVGTNKPQGRRLEFGFTGADSLGRVYDQPAYPHLQPALDEFEPQFLAELETYIGKALG